MLAPQVSELDVSVYADEYGQNDAAERNAAYINRGCTNCEERVVYAPEVPYPRGTGRAYASSLKQCEHGTLLASTARCEHDALRA